MGLLNTDNTVTDKNAKKLESLKRFKEKRAERAQLQYKGALELRDALAKAGVKLSDEVQNFLNSLCVDPALKKTAGTAVSSTLTALFGPNPKVGDKVTLRQAFDKTDKGASTLAIWIRKQAEKGLIIKINPNTQDGKLTEYVIAALPKA